MKCYKNIEIMKLLMLMEYLFHAHYELLGNEHSSLLKNKFIEVGLLQLKIMVHKSNFAIIIKSKLCKASLAEWY